MNFAKKQIMILLSISCILFISCKRAENKSNQESQGKIQIEESNNKRKIRFLIKNNTEKSFFVDKVDIDSNNISYSENNNSIEISFYDSLDYIEITGIDGEFNIEIYPYDSFYFSKNLNDIDYAVIQNLKEKKDDIEYYFFVSPEKHAYGNYRERVIFLKDRGIRLKGSFVEDIFVFTIN